MSYGIEVKNQAGEIVFDTTSAVLVLDEAITLNGVSAGGGLYSYPRQLKFRVLFYDLTNRKIGLDLNGDVLIDAPTISARRARPPHEISYTPSDYGIEVFNPAGDLLYTSDFQMIPIRDKVTLSTASGQGVVAHNGSKWVAPLNSMVQMTPFDATSTGVSRIMVERTAANFELDLDPIGTTPGTISNTGRISLLVAN